MEISIIDKTGESRLATSWAGEALASALGTLKQASVKEVTFRFIAGSYYSAAHGAGVELGMEVGSGIPQV